jgi:hypothetical protein
MTLLLWSLVMLGPTILAEDAPHFLRAVGLLPAILFFPAIGLEQLWKWIRLPAAARRLVVAGLLVGSLVLTVNDYFVDYGRQPETGYWFEAAARNLAENINAYEVSEAGYYLDQRFWDGWPDVRFLVNPDREAAFFRPENVTAGQFGPAAVVYIWPYEGLEQALNGFAPGLVSATSGELAQGDLETRPYPFYSRFTVEPAPDWPVLANFDNSIQLRQANVIGEAFQPDSDHQQRLIIDLYWSTTRSIVPGKSTVFDLRCRPEQVVPDRPLNRMAPIFGVNDERKLCRSRDCGRNSLLGRQPSGSGHRPY